MKRLDMQRISHYSLDIVITCSSSISCIILHFFRSELFIECKQVHDPIMPAVQA